MRPKKKVLFYCADDDRRSDMAYVLGVRCGTYLIRSFSSIAEVCELVQCPDNFDCVVIAPALALPGCEDRSLDERIDLEWLLGLPGVSVRSVELRAAMDMDRPSLAGRVVPTGKMDALLAAMATAAAHKRGPKCKRSDDLKVAA